jgi:Xaa-Pro dipeptidase
MSQHDIQVEACRGRQRRVLELMQRKELDLVVVTQIEHVQYLAGPRFGWLFQPSAALSADGKLTLVAPNKAPEVSAADHVVTYQAQKHSTLRNDQRQASSEVLAGTLAGRKYRRIGVESSTFGQHLAQAFGAAQVIDIEPDLYELRRRKDPDELGRLRKAIAGTNRMYARAREIIRPGISELEVFNELQGAAVNEFGEMMTGTGNDYQCCSRGGPPRAGHSAQAGELYILDLGPAFRGYFADNCRTFAVTKPDSRQQEAWSYIKQVFEHLERTVRPGKSCRELYDEVCAILKRSPVGIFDHHLGHGIGLFPHEAPHLNPNWDDVFQEGEIFTAEPGLYSPELRVGMRLENDYLVTANGVELLSDFPLEL